MSTILSMHGISDNSGNASGGHSEVDPRLVFGAFIGTDEIRALIGELALGDARARNAADLAIAMGARVLEPGFFKASSDEDAAYPVIFSQDMTHIEDGGSLVSFQRTLRLMVNGRAMQDRGIPRFPYRSELRPVIENSDASRLLVGQLVDFRNPSMDWLPNIEAAIDRLEERFGAGNVLPPKAEIGYICVFGFAEVDGINPALVSNVLANQFREDSLRRELI